ncbi:MAG: cytochrome d ubiquinol oxidase subunit II [Demequinaceae bacterium]|nr:cytochrome d ubiquinol oxidase subunit II [Demequinaceae bacterium]
MDLAAVWFIIIAVLWTGYFVLEGFDFGVGMLLRIGARGDSERRVAINTIGPVWDGNEVWLLTAGGATFAAFPEWYATLFSGFYLPLLVILLALIVRAVSIEYRSKINDPAWRRRWDWSITVTAWVPSILWGVAFANIMRGVPIDEAGSYTGNLLTLLSPFALLGGLVTLTLFLAHGAIFLSLKTDGPIRERCGFLAKVFTSLSVAVAGVWAVWAQLAYSVTWTWGVVAVAIAGLLATHVLTEVKRFGWAFVFNSLVIVWFVALVFGSMYPEVMPSTTDPAFSLTIRNASSTDYTLRIMAWVAVFLTPVVMAYQSWTYWFFRRRLRVEDLPAHHEPTLRRG